MGIDRLGRHLAWLGVICCCAEASAGLKSRHGAEASTNHAEANAKDVEASASSHMDQRELQRAETNSDATATSTLVTPTHKDLIQWLVDARRRSATLARVVERLEQSNWKVFVQFGRCPEPATVACLLHIVGQIEGRPYLRVVVNRRDRHPDQIIATIAHELQHALEVAEAPGPITDGTSMAALFRNIGHVSVHRKGVITYETDAALAVGDAVLRELGEKGPLDGKP
jgi:hypothetical protein